MNKKEIFDELTFILKQINNQIEINETTALLAEAKLDSLEFINYITMVEEKFSLSVSDSDIAEFKLGIIVNMIDYISNKNG